MNSLKKWTNHHTEHSRMVFQQERGYRTGKALTRHVNAQHGGEIDPNCPACKAIAQKQNALSK